jgi:HD-GYP domain-containing protein (c-di-GMP phosphodiesterase class II)
MGHPQLILGDAGGGVQQATESERIGQLKRALTPAAGERAGSPPTIERVQRSVLHLLGSSERAHAARVKTFSTAVARLLGLDDSTTGAIAVAGALHDVGKAFVAPGILTKTEPLTRSDWAAIRRHPTIGAAALAPAVRRPEVLEIVRAHHERWDGRGYPDRSTGGDTPLGARIVGVVDAFAAMTERRCYRRPLGIDEAADELRTHSGSQFDPDCVRALERLLFGPRFQRSRERVLQASLPRALRAV